jgi:hypothetical protein
MARWYTSSRWKLSMSTHRQPMGRSCSGTWDDQVHVDVHVKVHDDVHVEVHDDVHGQSHGAIKVNPIPCAR